MNTLLRIINNPWGGGDDTTIWHLQDPTAPENACFCDGLILAEYDGIDFDVKVVKRGGITCPKCLEKVKKIKEVKL